MSVVRARQEQARGQSTQTRAQPNIRSLLRFEPLSLARSSFEARLGMGLFTSRGGGAPKDARAWIATVSRAHRQPHGVPCRPDRPRGETRRAVGSGLGGGTRRMRERSRGGRGAGFGVAGVGVRMASAVILGLLPMLAGCAVGTLDRSQIASGRPCFDEPAIQLAVGVASRFVDASAEAIPGAGWLAARGTERMLENSKMFARVYRRQAPQGQTLRQITIEGRLLEFTYWQDFRWFLVYGGIFAIPLVGVSILTVGLFMAGLPVYSDCGSLELELLVRDRQTGELLGTYVGKSELRYNHTLWSTGDSGTFWTRPERIFGPAIRRAISKLMQDRRLYRRLAAR